MLVSLSKYELGLVLIAFAWQGEIVGIRNIATKLPIYLNIGTSTISLLDMFEMQYISYKKNENY